MLEIVGLVGVIGSGKTYQRDILIKKGHVPVDFKDALIEMVEDIVGFPIKDHYEEFKVCVVGLTNPAFRGKLHQPYAEGEKLSPSALSDVLLKQYPGLITGRVLLQRVGTEVMRKRNPYYWVNAWKEKVATAIKAEKSVVCADCRFPNEVEAIRCMGHAHSAQTRVVFCNYVSPRYDSTVAHESEKMAQDYIKKGLKDLDVIAEELQTYGVPTK